MIVAALVVLVFEYRRIPSHWIAPFLAVVLIGQSLVDQRRQGDLRSCAPHAEPDRASPGPFVPERSHRNRRRILGCRRAARRSHSWRARACGPHRWRGGDRGRGRDARACSSTCTGSPTSSAGSRSGGPGSRSVRSRSADASSASVLPSPSRNASWRSRASQYRPARRRCRGAARRGRAAERGGRGGTAARRVRSGRAGGAGDAHAGECPPPRRRTSASSARAESRRVSNHRTGSLSASSVASGSSRCSRARRRRVSRGRRPSRSTTPQQISESWVHERRLRLSEPTAIHVSSTMQTFACT